MLEETVIIKWQNSNKKYYVSYGYKFTKIGDEFKINIEHLPLQSNLKINYSCDECGVENQSVYASLIKRSKKYNKHLCQKCTSIRKWEEKKNKIVKDNSFGGKYPQLIKEWSDKNDSDPFKFTSSSNQKVLWKCNKGHEWEAKIANRTRGTGCPYCSGRLTEKNNSIVFTDPEIMEEWDFAKNKNIDPYKISKGSNKIIWWKCKLKHSWKTKVGDKQGCPYCSGRYATIENNLKILHPELVEEWDYENNIKLPEYYTPFSNKRVNWICLNGHKYSAIIANRVNGGNCPYCSNRKVDISNCLATTHPELLKEWDYENNIITPFEVTFGRGTKVWWKCPKGHRWKTEIFHRTGRETGCPVCNASKGERKIEKYLSKFEYDFTPQKTFEDCKFNNVLPFDFYIENSILIEYDGEQHFKPIKHMGGIENFLKTKVRDNIKNQYCKQNNILLIRIPYWDYEYIESILYHVLNYFNITDKQDIDKNIVHKYLVNHPDWSHDQYIKQAN